MSVVLHPYLSLCSGAGGLDLGVGMALRGAGAVCYVEHEVTACEVLAARIADGALDDAPIWTDLHAFDGKPWRGRVAGIIGGYPCQPFSVAGKRLGTADPRHLWPSIERIIGEIEPRWCFFENVGGHLRLGYFDVVKPSLERLGYRVAEGLFTASEVGAPHQRERLFILAHRDAAGFGREWRGEVPGDGDAPRGDDADGCGDGLANPDRFDGHGSRHAGPGRRFESSNLRHSLADAGDGQLSKPGRRTERRAGPAPASEGVYARDGVRLANSVIEGLEGRIGTELEGQGKERGRPDTDAGRPGGAGLPAFPPGPGDIGAWRRILEEHPELAPAVEPAVRGVADGVDSGLDLTRTARLRITGNGVVPAAAALAFRTLWGQLADARHPEQPGGGGDES